MSMHHHMRQLACCTALLATIGCASVEAPGGSAPDGASVFPRQEPFAVREFRPFLEDRWIGNAVSYGPHRDGQHPGGPGPTKSEIREDLEIISKHWNLIRLYGSGGPTETVLEVIRENDLDIKVMLGVWIASEETRAGSDVPQQIPDKHAANRSEIEAAIRLASEFAETVIAINVGNETQVSWSAHRSSPERLIEYIREVRARTRVPVTSADDYNFWNKPESHAVARELDIIVLHAHPLWNGLQLEDALEWTSNTYDAIRAEHRTLAVVLGETGWATRKHVEGEQATLIKGTPGEAEQAVFYDAVTEWARRERVTTFFFEAFDEKWKGGPHPDEVEKHWGLFRSDRTPKAAMADGT